MTIPFVAIVDDDPQLCASLGDLMQAIGYRAKPFASAEAFLLSASLRSFNCIIADVHMPGMGGLNLVRELQVQDITTPVILITALPGEHLEREAISLGALCLLRKPFEISALLGCVEKGLRQ